MRPFWRGLPEFSRAHRACSLAIPSTPRRCWKTCCPARRTSSSARTSYSARMSKFKNLGLLVIDEEQRFGVSHKERIKDMKRDVDVLTLSATPIPRTLEMALTGIRDMSTIDTPPEIRKEVQAYVLPFDWGMVRDAILKELNRGGQVFFVCPAHQRNGIAGRRYPPGGAGGARHLCARAHDRSGKRGGHERLYGTGIRCLAVHNDHRIRHRHPLGQHDYRV